MITHIAPSQTWAAMIGDLMRFVARCQRMRAMNHGSLLNYQDGEIMRRHICNYLATCEDAPAAEIAAALGYTKECIRGHLSVLYANCAVMRNGDKRCYRWRLP